MNGLLILILIVIAAVFLFKDCKVRCCPSENYAGQTFASRAGGVAGPCPNYFRHVDYGSMAGCGPSDMDYDFSDSNYDSSDMYPATDYEMENSRNRCIIECNVRCGQGCFPGLPGYGECLKSCGEECRQSC